MSDKSLSKAWFRSQHRYPWDYGLVGLVCCRDDLLFSTTHERSRMAFLFGTFGVVWRSRHTEHPPHGTRHLQARTRVVRLPGGPIS